MLALKTVDKDRQKGRGCVCRDVLDGMPTESLVQSSARLLTVARKIDHLLSEVIALQRQYVERICPECEPSCCKRVSRLFNEKDLVFVKVLGPNGGLRRRLKGKRGCPYLSSTGCLLEPKARPFTCHRYLCSRLEEEMNGENPDLVGMLNRKFRMLERLRGELLGEYIQVQGKRGAVYRLREKKA